MPAKVISTIHQLVAACKKYQSIVFIDKDDIIINETNDPDMEAVNTEIYNNNMEITGVDYFNTETAGVDNTERPESPETIAAPQTGLNTGEESINKRQIKGLDGNNNDQDSVIEEQYKDARDDDNVSVEEDLPKET